MDASKDYHHASSVRDFEFCRLSRFSCSMVVFCGPITDCDKCNRYLDSLSRTKSTSRPALAGWEADASYVARFAILLALTVNT